MKDLFMCLLINITKFGKLTGANLFNDDYSSMTLENEHGEYTISVTRRDKKEEETEDAN